MQNGDKGKLWGPSCAFHFTSRHIHSESHAIKLHLFLMNLRPPIIYSNADFHEMWHTNHFKRTNRTHAHTKRGIKSFIHTFVVDFTAIEHWIEHDFSVTLFYFWAKRKKNCSNLAQNPIYSLFINIISLFLLYFLLHSFDVRGRPLNDAQHWSAPETFGSRARFNADVDPATLDIKVSSFPRIDFFSLHSSNVTKIHYSRFLFLNNSWNF